MQLPSLGQSEKEALVARFSDAEITSAVWDCGGDKSPGPDGLNFNFIKQFWKILKPDFMRFLDEFYNNASFPKGSNASFIALILFILQGCFVEWNVLKMLKFNCRLYTHKHRRVTLKLVVVIRCPFSICV